MRRPDIIPPEWVDDHRPVAAATMTEARCAIRGKDVKVTDPATGRTTIQAGPIILNTWDGKPGVPCRVQRTDRGQRDDITPRQVITNDYMIGIPYTPAVITPGCLVVVAVSKDDRLTGRTFTVVTELTGSLVWERDLWVTDNES